MHKGVGHCGTYICVFNLILLTLPLVIVLWWYMLKWYWYVHVLFKQRVEALKQYQSISTKELEEAERKVSKWKDNVKKYETAANEEERKLNQLQKEGLFW